jgi:hypothetical protein
MDPPWKPNVDQIKEQWIPCRPDEDAAGHYVPPEERDTTDTSGAGKKDKDGAESSKMDSESEWDVSDVEGGPTSRNAPVSSEAHNITLL